MEGEAFHCGRGREFGKAAPRRAAARVSADMDDATVDELAATALPAWHNFAFEVRRLRADYLLRRD